MERILTLIASLMFSASLHAAGLDAISNRDAAGGLKQALDRGAEAAIGKLGITDGFFGNPKVKIPLPDALQKADKAMRMFGMGAQADELILSMNRAAEAAVPEAKKLLQDAVKKMTVEDAKRILTGGDTAVTEYFRKSTEQGLTQKFLPIVKQTTAKVGLAQQYNAYAGQAAQFGLVKGEDANIEAYVTRKALDGLYLMIAEEERAIRQDPLKYSGNLLQKVFGAMK